jgi:peroxiredoxin
MRNSQRSFIQGALLSARRVYSQPGRLLWLIPIIALIAFAGLVVELSAENRALEQRLIRVSVRAGYPHAGLYLPGFESRGLDGERISIGSGAASERQVLLVFNTKCQFCRASIPAWKIVSARVDSLHNPELRTLGLSLDSVPVTRQYVLDHHIPYPIVFFPSPKFIQMYRALNVPETMVLDGEGKILYAHRGVLTDKAVVDSVVAAVKQRNIPTTGPAVVSR